MIPPLHGLLYLISNRQDSTYHSLCYTSCGALALMKNGSVIPPCVIDLMTYHTMSGISTTNLHVTPPGWGWMSIMDLAHPLASITFKKVYTLCTQHIFIVNYINIERMVMWKNTQLTPDDQSQTDCISADNWTTGSCIIYLFINPILHSELFQLCGNKPYISMHLPPYLPHTPLIIQSPPYTSAVPDLGTIGNP